MANDDQTYQTKIKHNDKRYNETSWYKMAKELRSEKPNQGELGTNSHHRKNRNRSYQPNMGTI